MKITEILPNKDFLYSHIKEEASAGATSAASVGVGPIYANNPPKQKKKKDGTAVNALDMKGVNLLTGGSIKRR